MKMPILQIFHESNGQYSFTRVFGFMTGVTFLVLLAYVTIREGVFPAVDTGLAMLIVGLISGTYAANVFSPKEPVNHGALPKRDE